MDSSRATVKQITDVFCNDREYEKCVGMCEEFISVDPTNERV